MVRVYGCNLTLRTQGLRHAPLHAIAADVEHHQPARGPVPLDRTLHRKFLLGYHRLHDARSGLLMLELIDCYHMRSLYISHIHVYIYIARECSGPGHFS